MVLAVVMAMMVAMVALVLVAEAVMMVVVVFDGMVVVLVMVLVVVMAAVVLVVVEVVNVTAVVVLMVVMVMAVVVVGSFSNGITVLAMHTYLLPRLELTTVAERLRRLPTERQTLVRSPPSLPRQALSGLSHTVTRTFVLLWLPCQAMVQMIMTITTVMVTTTMFAKLLYSSGCPARQWCR